MRCTYRLSLSVLKGTSSDICLKLPPPPSRCTPIICLRKWKNEKTKRTKNWTCEKMNRCSNAKRKIEKIIGWKPWALAWCHIEQARRNILSLNKRSKQYSSICHMQRMFLYLIQAENVPRSYLAIASSIVGLHSSKIIKSKSNRLIIAAERKSKRSSGRERRVLVMNRLVDKKIKWMNK